MRAGMFDRECESIRIRHRAGGVIVLVFASREGSGFSVTTRNVKVTKKLPALLREVADQIEADISWEAPNTKDCQ